MTGIRMVKKVSRSRPTVEGAGVHLKRVFGFSEAPALDPFLLLDDFRSGDPEHYIRGFPWHPHRGIETITYILKGRVEHGDSLGNAGVIGPGDVQWMTAGSGIIHQEMPKSDEDGRMEGFQLWANLPAVRKMTDPRYREVQSRQIPEVDAGKGVKIRIICGRVGDVEGPVRNILIEPNYLDVTVPPGTEYLHPTPPGHTVLAYVIGGRGRFCREKEPFTYPAAGLSYFELERRSDTGDGELVVFEDGDQLFVATAEEPFRFLLISGRPLREPVAWYGPIVMNTQEELRLAFEEYRQGTFIKQGKA
jgi:redox-sensitive bicupin YhaK (pirin superfamily)